MLFLKITKKNLKFLSLTFFVFFISCVTSAQDMQNQISPLLNLPENSTKLPLDSSEKNQTVIEKNQVEKNFKHVEKNKNKVKKKKKKIRRIIKKRIIKRIYVINNQNEKKVDKTPVLKAEEATKTDEDLDKYDGDSLDKYPQIDGEYIIESELKENCDKIMAEQCFRRDKFFQEPYFHYTVISIFKQKVIAQQFFEGDGRARDKVFLRVNDGGYLLYTKNKNKVFLIVKNGLVEKFVLIEGDLANEYKITNKCQYADKLLAFHRLYQTNEIKENTIYYSDAKNFKGLIEATIFSEKNQSENFYSIFKIPNQEIRSIQNLNLCKRAENVIAIEKELTKKECNAKIKCTMSTLESYGSEGFETENNNYTYEKFLKDQENIFLDPEQSKGLMNEVSKLSLEDKNFLGSKCFKNKNIDFINCSKLEKCQDYLEIEGCEVQFYNDFDGFKY